MSLLTIGTVAFDTIETPFGLAEKIIGGSASYISTSASYFVDYSNIVAVIGDDFPPETLGKLRDRNVDLQGLQIKEGEKSFFWAGKYHIDMNSRDTMDTQLNVLETFDPVIPEAYQNCQFLMLGNLSPAVQLKVIERLRNRPKLVVLDTMNFWMDVALDNLKKVISRVDVLTVNDEEARQLTGEHFLPQAARTIHAMGPKTVVIKKGEHGALMFQGGEVFFAPAYPLDKVVDPTGAGDTFAGGFVGYLSARYSASGALTWDDMKQAVVVGSVMASFTCEAFGTSGLASLTAQDMKNRWQDYTQLSACGDIAWPEG